MEPKIGIKKPNLAAVAKSLNIILSDEHVLYIKTRHAHWNVEGPDFYAQHKFFEDQYTQLEGVIDEIAERVRSIGQFPVATMQKFLELTQLTEQTKGNSSQSFIKELLDDHETIIRYMRDNIKKYEEEWDDIGTSDFITGMMELHEKMAWMLRAHLK